jgi:DNA-binding transcriptional regulator LsrR (DeoR family)
MKTKRPQRRKPKLTPARADAIRRQYKRGMTQSRLAEKYGIAQATVSNVVTGRIWNRKATP